MAPKAERARTPTLTPRSSEGMEPIPSGRPREFGRNAAGFTLIELSVVLFLMALMALLIIPSMAGLHVSRLKHESRRLAGRATFLYDQAAANKMVLRLTFNLDAQALFSHPDGSAFDQAGLCARPGGRRRPGYVAIRRGVA